MGRGKLSLKLIPNLKRRRTVFMNRKKSVLKKAYELSTLCDVQTCVFIASDCDPSTKFETWPPNHQQIQTMIRSYKSHSFPQHSSRNSSYDLNRFFSDRKNKILTDKSKLCHNVEDHHLDSLPEHQLKEFLASLDSKIGVVDGMIQFMEADYDHLIEQATGMNTPPFETPQFDISEFMIEQAFGMDTSSFETPEFVTSSEFFIEQASSMDTPPFGTPEFDISELLTMPDEFEFNVEGVQSLLEDKFLGRLVQNNPFNFDF